jgi:hypothetical protein
VSRDEPSREPTPATSARNAGPRLTPTLRRLYEEQGQSPWLDNLARSELQDGTMLRLVARGVL